MSKITQDEIDQVYEFACAAINHGLAMGHESMGWDDETDEMMRQKYYDMVERVIGNIKPM